MRRWTALLLIVVGGLLGRGAAMIVLADDLTSDPDGYLAHAAMLADGHGFAGPHTGEPTAFRPPMMAVLLAIPLRAGLSPVAAVVLLQLVAGAVTITLTDRLAVAAGLSSRAALIAASCVACDPLLMRYSALPMSEPLSAALLTLGLLGWRMARSSSDAGSSRLRTAFAAAAGAVFGLLALTRPVGYVVLCLLCGGTLCAGWFGGRMIPRMSRVAVLRFVGAAFAGCGVVVLPWMIRNAVQFQTFLPATTHGGYTLALANNPTFYSEVIDGTDRVWSGESLSGWQQRMASAAAQEGVPVGDELATDAWMYEQAWETIRGAPHLFLRSCVYRLQRFWSVRAMVLPPHAAPSSQPARGAAAQPPRPASLVQWAALLVAMWYSLLWAGCALSVLAGLSGRSRCRLRDLWLAVLAFLAVHSLYWTDTRMRAPLMPVLAILAVTGWCVAVRAVGSGRRAAVGRNADR